MCFYYGPFSAERESGTGPTRKGKTVMDVWGGMGVVGLGLIIFQASAALIFFIFIFFCQI